MVSPPYLNVQPSSSSKHNESPFFFLRRSWLFFIDKFLYNYKLIRKLKTSLLTLLWLQMNVLGLRKKNPLRLGDGKGHNFFNWVRGAFTNENYWSLVLRVTNQFHYKFVIWVWMSKVRFPINPFIHEIIHRWVSNWSFNP